jgi:predicted helicase
MYRPADKERLKERDALLWSMDDEGTYGPLIHQLGFGEAVEKGLLSDYKVLTLTVSEDDVPESTREIYRRYRDSHENKDKMDDDWDTKVIGCVNALSKQLCGDGAQLVQQQDSGPMRRAVAFSCRIWESEAYCDLFEELTEDYMAHLPADRRGPLVGVEIEHIDGGMGAGTRQRMVQDLRLGPSDPKNCQILSNVRCLSEGVDVPTLDAVLYLAPKKSIVDVVQSVGRVMRHAPGKKYGYIIIPIFVSKDVAPEDDLDDSEKYRVLWQVLQALRSHDDRFADAIDKIDLNVIRPGGIVVGCPPRLGGLGQGRRRHSEALGLPDSQSRRWSKPPHLRCIRPDRQHSQGRRSDAPHRRRHTHGLWRTQRRRREKQAGHVRHQHGGFHIEGNKDSQQPEERAGGEVHQVRAQRRGAAR